MSYDSISDTLIDFREGRLEVASESVEFFCYRLLDSLLCLQTIKLGDGPRSIPCGTFRERIIDALRNQDFDDLDQPEDYQN